MTLSYHHYDYKKKMHVSRMIASDALLHAAIHRGDIEQALITMQACHLQ
jgi:hypothetical protein